MNPISRCLTAAAVASALVALLPGDAEARHRPSRSRLAREIRRDLAQRGVDFARDGTPEPQGDLSADGTCADGTDARIVPLVVPPPNSADMFTDTAYVCGPRYWARRTGGFMATDLWVGPFVLRSRLRPDGPRPR